MYDHRQFAAHCYKLGPDAEYQVVRNFVMNRKLFSLSLGAMLYYRVV